MNTWCTLELLTILLFTYVSRYIPLNSTVFGAENLPNMENTCVFALAGYQYIIMAVVVTKSFPHKKPLYHNGEFRDYEERGEAFRALLFYHYCCLSSCSYIYHLYPIMGFFSLPSSDLPLSAADPLCRYDLTGVVSRSFLKENISTAQFHWHEL